MIDGEEAGVGKGPSKKAAEQEAAREALAKLSFLEADVALPFPRDEEGLGQPSRSWASRLSPSRS